MKKIQLFYFVVFAVLFAFSGCSKDDDTQGITISTNDVTEIGISTAICGGAITNNNGLEIIAKGVCWSESESPNTDDNSTFDGAGVGNFESELTFLVPNTKYYVRAFAVSSNGTFYGNTVSFTTNDGIVNIGNNSYLTIQIGTQIWMAENLKETVDKNGFPLPLLESNAEWVSSDEERKICYPNNDPSKIGVGHGVMYNREAAIAACPVGWHLPSHDEWSELASIIGNERIAAASMKLVTGWDNNVWYGDNRSGFSAIPVGERFYHNGEFDGHGEAACFWSVDSSTGATEMVMLYGTSSSINYYAVDARMGLSVRCVKD